MAYHLPQTLTPLVPEFQRFDPSKCGFPPPQVPTLPALHWSDFGVAKPDAVTAKVLAGANVRHYARGRYALHAAYEAAGIGPAGALLAPAYHCRTMLDPALALDAPILLYKLNSDLTPQVESVRTLLASSQPKIKALVVPHYFGFEQPTALMAELLALCKAGDITLIEDCSHAWQVAAKRGSSCVLGPAHLAVASPYKFFACEDGGVLWGSTPGHSFAGPSSSGPLAELKALGRTVARSVAARRTTLLRESSNCETRHSILAAHLGEDVLEHSNQASALYDRRLQGKSSLALSRWVMRHSKVSQIVKKRRDNYIQWTRSVADLEGGRALFPDLPSDCAPYMFPLLISRSNPHFYGLKEVGLPIWRWDEMASSDCAVSSDYRLRLLHLPCHQGLGKEQMQWMTSTVAKVLA